MTIAEMLGQSGVLTLLGMGIVFSFLIILIISVTIMGKIIHALGADKDAGVPPATGTGRAGSSGGAKTTAVAAAITAAVNEYRKTNS
jgi:oxaloacetate decarboxylase gamma subunit